MSNTQPIMLERQKLTDLLEDNIKGHVITPPARQLFFEAHAVAGGRYEHPAFRSIHIIATEARSSSSATITFLRRVLGLQMTAAKVDEYMRSIKPMPDDSIVEALENAKAITKDQQLMRVSTSLPSITGAHLFTGALQTKDPLIVGIFELYGYGIDTVLEVMQDSLFKPLPVRH